MGVAGVPRQRRGAGTGTGTGDLALVDRMRAGDAGAYEELYRRHAHAVRRYARTCCRDADTADDLTSEVFAATLQAVRGGAGPRTAVRAYLLTSVRRVAAEWARTARREQLVEDFAAFAVSAATASGADAQAMREAEASMAVRAFRSLSERHQAVLWHTVVEEASPSEVAPLLGLTPNATAQLAWRAREELKAAYLKAHVSGVLTGSGGECARYAGRLGAFARGRLRAREERGLRKHLEECARCAVAASEVREVNQHLRSLLPVAVVGWFAAESSLEGAALFAGAAGAAGAGGAREGIGGAAKAGLAAGVVGSALAAALALTLTGGEGPEEERPVAEPERRAVEPSPWPEQPEPEPEPTSAPEHEPAPETAPETSPETSPEAEAELEPEFEPSPAPKPEPETEPVPGPEPEPEPTEAPEPEPSPSPTTTPPPGPVAYELWNLEYDVLSDGTEPAIALFRSSTVWRRDGMTIGGRGYEHGVSVRARSSVTVELNLECQVYRAMAGVDDATGGWGAVVFSVFGDGEELWRSDAVAGGDAAVPVSVPLAGVESLRLQVEPDEGTFLGGMALADWAESEIDCG
jgi:RNA polymerase sigma factor (sigma-70 family)